ncbi:MAG TPA: hypothetical protein VHF06_14355 [Pseudonocardiaceae bacterium]|nr:hypothetical protein [Pseudonocardiaceae bacterium]
MTAADSRVLTVRADSFFVRSERGVWLRNAVGSFSIDGGGAYELVALLFDRLDGSRTTADALDGLAAPVRDAAGRLVNVLVRNGFVKEVDLPAETVPDWLRTLYPEQLAYVDQHADHPVRRLTQVRNAPVACIGDGMLFRVVAGVLGDYGFADVRLATTQPQRSVADVIDSAAGRDHGLRWHVAGTGADRLTELMALPAVARAGYMLLASDAADPADIAAAEAVARSRGQVVGVLARAGGLLVAGPLGSAEPWCWHCLSRWVRATEQPDVPATVAAAPATLAALPLVNRLFCRIAGPPVPEDRSVTTVDECTPTVRVHRALPHPRCPLHGATSAAGAAIRWTDAPTRPDVPSPDDPAEVVAAHDRIVAAAGAWTDRITGPLLACEEADLSQVPLAASRCTVRDPVTGAAVELRCHGISPRETRNQVALIGLERLAEGTAEIHGAGWSAAEAAYRALFMAAIRTPATPPAGWHEVPDTEEALTLRGFLLGIAGGPVQRSEPVTLPSGFVRVTVRDRDRTADGLGLDVEHALNQALLNLAAHPGERTALLRPPTQTWAGAVERLTAPAFRDAAHRLPFLDGAAYLVAVPGATR